MIAFATHTMRPLTAQRWPVALAVLALALMITGSAPAAAQLDPGPWVTGQADNRNTSQSRSLAGVPEREVQTANVFSPIATDGEGNLYFLTFNGSELILRSHAPDGSERWSMDVSGNSEPQVQASPVISKNGYVYFVAPSSSTPSYASLYRVPRNGGSPEPVVDDGVPLTGAPAIGNDGILYVPRLDGSVLFVRASDLNVLDGAQPDGTPVTSPVVAPDGRIIVGTQNGGVFAISPAADVGESLVESNGDFKVPPALGDNGVLYIITAADPENDNIGASPELVAVNFGGSEEDGVRWQRTIESGLAQGLTVSPDGDVYLATLNTTTSTGTVHRFGAESGEEVWQQSIDAVVSAPSFRDADPSVYVPAPSSGDVRVLSGASGAFLPSIALPGEPAAGLPATIAGDGDVIIPGAGGLLLANSARPAVSPQSLSFGPVLLDNPDQQSVTISQPSSASLLNVTDVAVTGPGADRYALGGADALISEGIPAGDNASLDVTFQSSTAGTYGATLVISTELYGSLQVSLSGQAVQSGVSAQPTPLVFDATQIQSPVTRSLDISSSDSDVTINSATILNDAQNEFSAPDISGQQINSGSTFSVDVTFTPDVRGTRVATFRLETDGGLTLDVPLEGVGLDASITATPNPADFGTWEVGASETRTITLSNPGQDDLSISGISVASAGSSDFEVTGGGDQTVLAAGASITVDVTFQPSVGGDRLSELVVTSTQGPEARVDLVGVGVLPDLVVNPDPLSFGPIEDDNAQTKSITLDNPKSVDVAVTGISIDNDDFRVVTPKSFMVPGNTTETVDVEFDPTSVGTQSGTLTINTDAGFSRTVNLEAEAQNVAISATPAPVEFAVTDVGNKSNVTVSIENTGSATLDIGTIDLSGDADFSFEDQSQVDDLEANGLAAGGTTDLVISYVPDNQETDTGTLSIPYTLASTSIGGTLQVGVSGSGSTQSSKISILNGPLAYGPTAVGETERQTIQVRNTSGSDLEVSDFRAGGTDAGQFSVDLSTLEDESGQPVSLPITLPGGTGEPDDELFVDVVFAPSQSGSLGAQFIIQVGGSNNNINNSTTLSGTAVEPVIAATPDPVDLGSVPTGAQTTTGVTLANDTDVDFAISSIDVVESSGSTGFSLDTSSPLPNAVPSNGSVVVDINHASSTVGLEEATLEVASVNNTLQVPLQATVENYGIAFTESSVSFASVPVDSSTSKTVTIENTGSAPVDFSIGTGTAGDAADFEITSGQRTGTIVAGDTRTVTVTFTPSNSGVRSADLTVQATAGGEDVGSDSVQLEGSGLTYGSTLSSSTIDFGQVQVGSTSSVQTISVENTGSAVLSILGLALPSGSPFRITSGRGSFSLLSGDALNVSVEFRPTEAQFQSSVLEILTLNGTIQVGLEGRGIKELDPTEEELTFPPRLDTEAPDTLTAVVTNTNDIDAEITDVSLSGTDASAFSIVRSGTLPTLVPGDSASVPVTLTATSPGSFSASLDVTASTGTVQVSLSGQILSAPSIDPDTLAFGTVIVGTPKTLSTTVANTGSEEISVTEGTRITSGRAGLVVTTPLPVTIPQGQSATLDLQYDPADAVGRIQDTLSVETSRDLDTDGLIQYTTQQVVHVSADVVTPPELTVDPGTDLNFGALAFGQTTRTLPVQFINTGGATLTVSNASFETNDGTFSLSTDPTGDIAPGDTLAFTMTADPTALGETERLFQVASNGGQASFTARVRAIDVDLRVSDVQFGAPTEAEVTLPSFASLVDNSLYVRPGGAADYEQVPFVQQSETEWATQIPARLATLRGLDYYFVVDDGTDRITLPASTQTASRNDPVHARTAFQSVTAPIDLPVGEHRMVSVPAELETTDAREIFGDDYGAFDPRVWRLLRYDPDRRDYREARGIRSVEKGQGFWLATRDGTPFTIGPGLSTDASSPITLEVRPGWNQIASPFGFAVAWTDVENTDALQAPVVFNGGTYNYAGTLLRPWSGAWVFNPTDSAIRINIPPTAASTSLGDAQPIASTASAAPAQPEDGYTLQVRGRLHSGDTTFRDEANYLGLREGASAGPDSLDFAEAPPVGDHVRISVRDESRVLAGSYLPPSDDGQTWELDVSAYTGQTRTGGEETVRVQVNEYGSAPDGFEVFAFDLDRQMPLAVSDGAVEVPVDGAAPTRLRIVAGTKAFARTKSEGIPLEQIETALDKPYPNPFSDAATIDYQLKKEGHVRMEVFDLLGRRVAVLVDGRKSAGPHTLTWQAQTGRSRLASGVYFLRMRAGDFTATRKMTLVR
ncbi:choice-of-anchor D domain-containing protein [Longibacter sp.]|uniref:choice-of-anchor D domain-containing protein n=1 Tax=Longibacter sp. TaxID=2045415 RepID=UPI003EBB9C67